MTILYIGENIAFSEFYSINLDVQIVAKRNGIEAINVLQDDNDIDIIISDYNLPRRLRSRPGTGTQSA